MRPVVREVDDGQGIIDVCLSEDPVLVRAFEWRRPVVNNNGDALLGAHFERNGTGFSSRVDQ
jgi:hypothetical protein